MSFAPHATACAPSATACALVALAAGCVPTTEIVIELQGHGGIDGATIEVVAIGPDGVQTLPTQTLDVDRLPLEIPLVPLGGDPTRRFVVDVTVSPTVGPERVLRLRGRFEADRLIRAPVWIVAPPVCTDAITSRCAVRPRAPAGLAFTGSVHARGPLTPTFAWDEVPDADRYELQIDGTCADISPALCPFTSLERSLTTTETRITLTDPLPVSRVQPVGRRYVWRVRACGGEACSAWSEPRALEVGRQRTDFDGDGYADLVAPARYGIPSPDYGRGIVFRWAGQSDIGTLGEPDQSFGSGPCRLGEAVGALGDTDGDGYPDLAVTSSPLVEPCFGNRLGGEIFVHHGGPEGLVEEGVSIPSPEMDTPQFGGGVSTAGDLDKDGLADIAIPVGDRLLFYAAREDRTFVAVSSAPNTSRQPRTTCCADLDRDGRDDIAATSSDGAVVVSDGALETIAAPTVPAGVTFSMDVALPDMDGDGNVELLAGSCAGDFVADRGGAFVRTEPDGSFVELAPPATAMFDGLLGHYACFVAALGDIDGDGHGDVAAGAPFTHTVDGVSRGQMIVWLEGGVRSIVVRGTGVDGYIGLSMAGVGDLNGDGIDDVVSSSMREPHDFLCDCGGGVMCLCPAGMVEIYLGRLGFDGALPDHVLLNPQPANNADFGFAIASAHP